jgi:hypothetical protein
MAGWDDQAIQDNLERWQGRKSTRADEVTREEEVLFYWTILVRENRRHLVWRWAQLSPHDRFSAYCKKKGIASATAYRWLDEVWSRLQARFVAQARLLRWPDQKWMGQQTPVLPSIPGKLGDDSIRPFRKPRHAPFRTEKHRDELTTVERAEEFSEKLVERNERLRKKRLRKALRGIPGEAGAAA